MLRVVLLVLAASACLTLATPLTAGAEAYTIADGDVAALVDAIDDANASGSDSVINLAAGGTYTLTVINNSTSGDNGLPSIAAAATAGRLTINGNGATIERQSGADAFRILHLSPGADLTLNGLTIAGGSVLGGDFAGFGGGILSVEATLALTNSTVSGNTATTGGGIYGFQSTLTLTNATVSGNTASEGGGIVSLGVTVTLTNATVSGNTAADTGGGIVSVQGTLTLTNATVSGNTAAVGGGIFAAFNTSLTLTNTLIAGSTGGNCGGVGTTFGVEGSNLADDPTCPAPLVAQVPAVLIGPLADNGGPTQTHALLAGSPAIDAGHQAACVAITPNTDQRGLPRTAGLACDIGAYELQQSADLALTKTVTGDAAAFLPGAAVTYLITAQNHGPTFAGGVVVTDTLPDGVTYLGDTCAAGPPQGQTLTWEIGPLAAGESAGCEVTVTIDEDAAGGELSNSAVVSAVAPDPAPANNNAAAVVEVVRADLAVTKLGPEAGPPGASLTYAVVVTNLGSAAAAAVVIEDVLTGAVFASVDASPGVVCEQAGTTLTCELEAPLEAGSELVVWVTVTAPQTAGTTGLVNRVCVSSSTPEETEANNCAEVGTSIIADVPIPPVPAVGPHLYQPDPAPTPSATGTPEPTEEPTEPQETPTLESTATATSEPEPTATPTSEPTEPAATATATPDSGTGAGDETPSATATPTPIREAPMPPETGSGSATGGTAALWLTLGGLALALIGAASVGFRQATSRR